LGPLPTPDGRSGPNPDRRARAAVKSTCDREKGDVGPALALSANTWISCPQTEHFAPTSRGAGRTCGSSGVGAPARRCKSSLERSQRVGMRSPLLQFARRQYSARVGPLDAASHLRGITVLTIMLSCIDPACEHQPCGMMSGEYSPGVSQRAAPVFIGTTNGSSNRFFLLVRSVSPLGTRSP
jgi:hypothetical protein